MKVCHLSDWHGKFRRLPPADLYVITGDMLPNFPHERILVNVSTGEIVTHDPFDQRSGPPPQGASVGNHIDRRSERIRQTEWCMQQPFRLETGLSEDACVLVVRGNHDFIPLSEWIGGDVWEVDDDSSRTTNVYGLKFGGTRGINPLRGRWADELPRIEFDLRMRQVPSDVDVFISHSPPYGILDLHKDGDVYCGSPSIASWMNSRSVARDPLRLHMFGHVHERIGTREFGGILFSNAATGVNMVDL